MKTSSLTLKKILGILFICCITALGVAAAAYSILLQPVAKDSAQMVRFIIPKGQAISIIGQRLHEEGLIKHPLVFRFVVEKNGLAASIQSGSFDLSPAMNATMIAQKLTSGTEDIWVTLLEGWRAEEVAEALTAAGLESFDQKAFLELAKPDEGRLFPDTYLLPRQMSAAQVHTLLTNTFEKKITRGLESEIAAFDVDFAEVLVMASLVQREAREYEQMRRVAGILWHRIQIGMPLQVDATLQYVVGYSPKTRSWWSTPLAEYKSMESEFNTYQITGLPPSPISNPGLNAMKATLDPIETTDLFYIHAPDGKMYYAADLAGHNANINRYLR